MELVGVHLWFFRVARCTYTCIAVAVAVSELCVHQWQRLQMCHTILLHRSQLASTYKLSRSEAANVFNESERGARRGDEESESGKISMKFGRVTSLTHPPDLAGSHRASSSCAIELRAAGKLPQHINVSTHKCVRIITVFGHTRNTCVRSKTTFCAPAEVVLRYAL